MSVLYIVAVENLWHVGQNGSYSYETREFRNVMIVLFSDSCKICTHGIHRMPITHNSCIMGNRQLGEAWHYGRHHMNIKKKYMRIEVFSSQIAMHITFSCKGIILTYTVSLRDRYSD